jgi:hypothetical protein
MEIQIKRALQQAYNRIIENNVDLYGNGRNRSQVWTLLTEDEKAILVNYIIETP